jgi:hypothetical protein
MVRRRRGSLLAAGLMLVGAALSASPAAAAPSPGPCQVNCYSYVADISVEAWTSSSSLSPVSPGSRTSFTARVTNTGWRIGGYSVPVPWQPGPTSGTVIPGFLPAPPGYETGVGCQVDSGPSCHCTGGFNHSLWVDLGSIPTGTTYQWTAFFLAPSFPGTFTITIQVLAYQGPHPWTEYNPDNDSVTLTYDVAYQA